MAAESGKRSFWDTDEAAAERAGGVGGGAGGRGSDGGGARRLCAQHQQRAGPVARAVRPAPRLGLLLRVPAPAGARGQAVRPAAARPQHHGAAGAPRRPLRPALHERAQAAQPHAAGLPFPPPEGREARRREAGASAGRRNAALPAPHELPVPSTAQRHPPTHARVAAPAEEAAALPVGVDGVPRGARVARHGRALLAALPHGGQVPLGPRLVLRAAGHEVRAVRARHQGHPAVAVLAGARGGRRRRGRRPSLPVDGDQQLPHRHRLLVRVPLPARELGAPAARPSLSQRNLPFRPGRPRGQLLLQRSDRSDIGERRENKCASRSGRPQVAGGVSHAALAGTLEVTRTFPLGETAVPTAGLRLFLCVNLN